MRILNRGLALLEALASMVILAIVVLTLAYLSRSGKSRRSNDLADCQNYVNEMVSSVDFLKNSLNMRNYFPTTASNTGPVAGPGDGFCNVARNLCTSNPFYGIAAGVPKYTTGFWQNPVRLSVGGVYTPLNYLYNYQNIRGSATWAQTVYNERAVVGGDLALCSGTGTLIGTPVQLNALMPQPGQSGGLAGFHTGAAQGYLYIKDSGVPCGTRSETDPRSEAYFDVKATIRFPGVSGVEQCSASTRVSFPRDTDRPSMKITLTNGGGTPFLDGAQTDGGVFTGGAEYKTVNIDIATSEGGLVYLCRLLPPLFADPAGDYTLCSEMTSAVMTVTILPDYTTTPTYNKSSNMRLTIANLSDTVLPFVVEITAVDVGGNFTATPVSFIVKSP
ncbi:MAG: hypothetical protein ABL958_04950 [Bdellovibrionia bacterium]